MNGVCFGETHSYDDLGMYLKSKPIVSPPKPKKKVIQVPGSNAVIDLTEMSGEVKYEPRELLFEFVVVGGRSEWSAVYSAILNTIHGKRMQITLDEDPEYYYVGRVEVNQWKSDKVTATIVISAEVEPYKYAVAGGGRSL